jgi:hypothetical protein
LFQALRLRVAEAAEGNPLLAAALARAAGVDPDTDLVSGAKAAAVVETLDEVAFGASDDFEFAREALRSGSTSQLRRQGYSADEIAEMERLRAIHDDLYARWRAGDVSPRRLRQELVRFYIRQGRKKIESRFFSED